MEIGVVEIRSAITPVDQEKMDGFFTDIERAGDFQFSKVQTDAFSELDFGLIFVATGGTEGIFLKDFNKLANKPCFLLTSGESNSLAASLEILTYLKQKGQKGEILHGDADYVAQRINVLYRAFSARKNLKGKKFGLLGMPSDWLIASYGNYEVYKEKLGIEIVEIPMGDVISEIKKGGYVENQWTRKLFSLGYKPEEMDKALSVYGGFKRFVDQYGLAGITVRCFDLLSTVFTTGCLGLSILNAEGIYAGCEGDLPALISMAILGECSGEPVFMCNPNRIDTKNNEMIFAHCTLPTNMPYEMSLTTHYESGIGVAIAGSIQEASFTIFKTSGDLSRFYVEEGSILENQRKPTLCRTQIKVKLPEYSYFTKDPISNHHNVCVGNHKSVLQEFFSLI